jgi:hypothetical protein
MIHQNDIMRWSNVSLSKMSTISQDANWSLLWAAEYGIFKGLLENLPPGDMMPFGCTSEKAFEVPSDLSLSLLIHRVWETDSKNITSVVSR